MKKEFSGSVKVKVQIGMRAKINTEFPDGKIHKGREFIIDSMPRVLCGSEVVALNKPDGSRFSPAYDLSMLLITDTSH